ncbi:MAG: M50 family metallopeptidase [Candidatus Sericytochromatia bacterium]|nr:M50 family metallopeptidase [Candidatus Sericytochromatia bacterium]
MVLARGQGVNDTDSWSEKIQQHALLISIVITAALNLLAVDLWLDQIFLTFVHEASHGLAAVLTGGTVLSLSIQPDGSGLALTRGGIRPIILCAGYAGSCLSGAGLLLAVRNRGWERWVCLALGGVMAWVTVVYVRSVFGFFIGTLMAIGFVWVGFRGSGWQLSVMLSFLAVRSILNSFSDLINLFRQAGGPQLTDAALLSQELTLGLVPPVVFAGLIAAVSLACLWGVVHWGWAREDTV